MRFLMFNTAAVDHYQPNLKTSSYSTHMYCANFKAYIKYFLEELSVHFGVICPISLVM